MTNLSTLREITKFLRKEGIRHSVNDGVISIGNSRAFVKDGYVVTNILNNGSPIISYQVHYKGAKNWYMKYQYRLNCLRIGQVSTLKKPIYEKKETLVPIGR